MLGLLLLRAPAIPLDEAGKYVAGAYIVFLVLLVVYVAIMGMKLRGSSGSCARSPSIAEQRKDGAADGASARRPRR